MATRTTSSAICVCSQLRTGDLCVAHQLLLEQWDVGWDDYLDYEEEDFVPSLGYRVDDTAMYDGRGKERSYDTLRELRRRNRQRDGLPPYGL